MSCKQIFLTDRQIRRVTRVFKNRLKWAQESHHEDVEEDVQEILDILSNATPPGLEQCLSSQELGLLVLALHPFTASDADVALREIAIDLFDRAVHAQGKHDE